ncbi:hypothetical protein [Aeromonas sobria]|uniref:hypothetical protein n=1 Tax=Aeromonas sobria TaxID=646 RepID=UPI0011E024ED|nr:hypothetical protein [Aeromonas sobria]
MIEITDSRGQKHLLSPNAIARVSEPCLAAKWNGVRAYVQLFDGTEISAVTAMESIANQMKEQSGCAPC